MILKPNGEPFEVEIKKAEPRMVGFYIYQSIVADWGQGPRYFPGNITLTTEQAEEMWETSPDNPKNKKTV